MPVGGPVEAVVGEEDPEPGGQRPDRAGRRDRRLDLGPSPRAGRSRPARSAARRAQHRADGHGRQRHRRPPAPIRRCRNPIGAHRRPRAAARSGLQRGTAAAPGPASPTAASAPSRCREAIRAGTVEAGVSTNIQPNNTVNGGAGGGGSSSRAQVQEQRRPGPGPRPGTHAGRRDRGPARALDAETSPGIAAAPDAGTPRKPQQLDWCRAGTPPRPPVAGARRPGHARRTTAPGSP